MANIKETYMTKQIKLHAEVRKVEDLDVSFTPKEGKRVEKHVLALKVDDDDEERVLLFDTDMSHKYEKGQTGTFTLRMDMEREFGTGNYTAKILVITFEPDKK